MAGLRVVRLELKMAGRALTLRYLPYWPDLGDGLIENRGAILSKRAVEEAAPGDILVVDMGGDTSTTFIGHLLLLSPLGSFVTWVDAAACHEPTEERILKVLCCGPLIRAKMARVRARCCFPKKVPV